MLAEIVATIIGGFVGWIVVQVVSYYVVRARLLTYLILHINTLVKSAHSNLEWFQQLSNEHSVLGVTPTVAPRYSIDRAEDLHESRELILRYLSKLEVERITKFLSYLWESECLAEGICELIGAYAKRATPLDADECAHIKDKVNRFSSIVKLWPHSIQSLNGLPIDYAGVLGPSAAKVPPKNPSPTQPT